MTDPFADLERELLAAHARRPRRLRAAPRVLAMAAAVAAALALVSWLGAHSEAEHTVSPAPQPASSSGAEPACGEAWNPPQSDEPVPDVITARMAIFRRPAGAAENTPDPRMTGRQARHVYADGRRTLPETGKWGVHAIAADILPRAQIGRQGDPCAAPQGTTEPGVCLVLTRKSGAMSACFTLGEIERGQAFIDADGRIVGFAPDGVRQARAAEHRAGVEDNLFTLPGGPQTKVDFEPAVTG